MRQNREQDFLAGLDLLTPFFGERDFTLQVHPAFVGEEGTFYSAQYVWGPRAVTLVHLFGLESVTYSIGQWCLDHVGYLEVLDVRQDAAWPTAAEEDPLAGYQALLSDLETRLTPFFEEPDREFIELAMARGQRGRPWIPGA